MLLGVYNNVLSTFDLKSQMRVEIDLVWNSSKIGMSSPLTDFSSFCTMSTNSTASVYFFDWKQAHLKARQQSNKDNQENQTDLANLAQSSSPPEKEDLGGDTERWILYFCQHKKLLFCMSCLLCMRYLPRSNFELWKLYLIQKAP